jgi:two-component system, OmpR family, phosphate regulon sensor histidine kinase PhoR
MTRLLSAGTRGHTGTRILGSIVAQLWAAGLLVGGLLAAGVIVATLGGLHQQQGINALTQVIQPLQVANTELRSGFSQCQTWYLDHRLTGREGYEGAYRACEADFQRRLGSTVRLARLAGPAVVPLVMAQDRAAKTWFALADRSDAGPGGAGTHAVSTQAVSSSVSFFASNTATQREIGEAGAQASGVARDSLASEIRYDGLFIGVMLVSMVVGVTVVVRSVVRPLASLTPTLARIAAGDHAARTTVTRPAEIAVVARSIDHLAEEGERLFRAEQEHTRLRALAREAGIRIRANLDEHQVVSQAVTALQGDLGSDLAFIMLLKDRRLELPQTSEDGLPADLVGELRKGVQRWPEELVRQRFVIRDLRDEQDRPVSPEIRELLVRHGFSSALCMPLGAGDELLGVVVGLRKDPDRPWSAMEIDAFEWVAADLGRGIKHAQMYAAEGELVERLRSLDRAKTDFISTVSHELRTPLTSIVGYVEILQDETAGALSPEQHAILETIDRNAARLRSLIEDVLTLSKIETGSFKTVMKPVRLAEVVSSAVEAVSPGARKAELTVISEVADPELRVDGDQEQLDRVLMNLLSNSVKFTPPGGTVTVSAYRGEEAAVIQVTDTGIGIPEKDKKDLFNRFFRASNAVRAAVPGTGLGLSIVRSIVANHGGDMDLVSDEGKGTTVTIRLPAPGQTGPRTARSSAAASP